MASDLRWASARLERFGPAAVAADLTQAATPATARLRKLLDQIAHLLARTEPPSAVIDILRSRVTDDPDWGPPAAATQDCCLRPRLTARRPLPDLADRALRRVLTGHTRWVNSVAISPDGTWLATATATGDRTARTWTADGTARATFTATRTG